MTDTPTRAKVLAAYEAEALRRLKALQPGEALVAWVPDPEPPETLREVIARYAWARRDDDDGKLWLSPPYHRPGYYDEEDLADAAEVFAETALSGDLYGVDLAEAIRDPLGQFDAVVIPEAE